MRKFTEYSIMGIIVILAVAAFSGAAPLVFSQSASTPCTAQLTYSVTTAAYVNQNIGLSVPVTVSCPFNNSLSSSLYAVGYAVDSSSGSVNLGSVSTVLPYSTTNANYYGRLSFTFPPSVLGHSLQISVTVYGGGQYGPINLNGQYNGSQMAVQTETVQINPSSYSSNWSPYYYGPSCYNGVNCYNAYQSPYGCYQNSYCNNLSPYGCYQNSSYCNFANGSTAQCQGSSSSTTTCSGYLYLSQNGCSELVVPMNGPYSQQVYQYYTLTNMPSSSAHTSGAWVTVTGQLSVNQSGEMVSNGASCPGNSINVTSMSP
jgi:hypothetical protein